MKLPGKLALIAVVAGFSLGAASPRQRMDLIIRGGTVYTGSDAPFVGDVAITGGRVRAVGPNLPFTAWRVIDAGGMIVAPGFIDPHAHIGEQLASGDAATRLIPAFLMQGVTTAFIGNDGGGNPELAEVLDSARTRPVGINYAAFAGFGPIRQRVIGETDRPPDAAELQRMRTMVARAMCQGALGLSTGLYYAPQSFASTEEVVALAHEAGARGGVYDSHIRDESSYSVGLSAAIDEAIAIGSRAGIPVNIAHIKALGVDVQGQAPAIIAKVEAARRAGQRVTADQYPWSASGTTLVAALMPGWALDGGRPALIKRFDDPAFAGRLRAGIEENLRKRGGAGALLIARGELRGRTLEQVANARREDPVAAAIALIRDQDVAVVSFNQSEQDIAAFMKQPWVMTSSDAFTGHPRVYGSFARKYRKYVVAERALTLREFVERSSALTADTFGIDGRGRLKPGAFADVVVFDPKNYAERATYEQPTLSADGVRAVVVNGVLAVQDGQLTGQAAGLALKHRPTPGTCR